MSHRPVKSPAAANAIGGKTARACDGCILRRARWYCAADDAFLCHLCDSSVHSANSLARRHERLRLQHSSDASPASAAPAWHNGFKRKARTPRQHHKPVVPELESSADDEEAEEEQLLYRVPILDPTLAFSNPSPPPATPMPPQAALVGAHGRVEFAPTELEIAEFAADMESLLGQGIAGGESFSLEELGLVDGEVAVNGEMEEDWKGPGLSFEMEVDLSRESLDLDFGCGLPEMVEEAVSPEAGEEGVTSGVGLRLNYEAVMAGWMGRGRSPWISDERPWVGADECWLACMGMGGGVGGEMGREIPAMSAGREARVTRYREKRRTRLYSKKIRYEVRKLNAEKRPRMKGRFVKRSPFTSAAAGRGPSGSGGGSVVVAC